MPLSTRQKNIPNPNYRTKFDLLLDDYDFEHPRNQQVLEAVHMGFLTTGKFPTVGSDLAAIGELSERRRRMRGTLGDVTDIRFTVADAYAYVACYPQNAKVDEIYVGQHQGVDYRENQLVPLSDEEATTALGEIANTPGIEKVLTVTTPESRRPENQDSITTTNPDLREKISQLPAVLPVMSREKIRMLLETVKMEEEAVISSDFYVLRDRNKSPSQPFESAIPATVEGTLDYDDWTKNVGPNSPFVTNYTDHRGKKLLAIVTYYNPNSNEYIAAIRTSQTNPTFYDLGLVRDNPLRRGNFEAIKRLLLGEGFVRAVGRDPVDVKDVDSISFKQNSAEWLGTWQRINGDITIESFYGDSTRPNPPAGTAPWLLAIKIPQEDFNKMFEIKPEVRFSSGNNFPPAFFDRLISDAQKTFRVPWTVGKLRDQIRDSEYVLKALKDTLESEAVVPEDFKPYYNIEEEILQLQKFRGETLDELLAVLRASEQPAPGTINDLPIEICINPKPTQTNIDFPENLITVGHVALNGTIDQQAYNLGYSGVFEKTSPTTLMYVYYSKEIAKHFNMSEDKWPPWVEMIQEYTVPAPTYYPSAASEKKRRQAASQKEKTFQTPTQIQKSVAERMLPSLKELNVQIRAAAGDCDTYLATIASELYLFAGFYGGGKVDYEGAIRRAVYLAKQQLIKDEQTRLQITNYERYVQNPNLIRREIEIQINRELACAMDLIGGYVQKAVLDPNQVPPGVKALVRKGLRPRFSISFDRTPSKTGFFSAWRKQLEQLIIDFAKQMILSVFKDVVKAALGCSPEQPEEEMDKVQAQKTKDSSTYGLVQVNALVDARGDIDMLSVAKEAGFEYMDFVALNGEKTNIKRDPNISEVRQFNKDASDILMAREMYSLLNGSASSDTSSLVLEMAKRRRPESLEDLSEEDLQNQAVVDSYGESLKEGDTKYAALTLSNEKILKYFSMLGDLLGNLENLLEELDPEDAYCEVKDPVVPGTLSGVDIGITNQQLVAQIDQQIEAKKNMILSLCELNNSLGFPNAQLQMNSFLEAFDSPEWYTNFLDSIAAFTNQANKAIADAMKQQMAGTPQPVRQEPTLEETKIYAHYGDDSWERGGLGSRLYLPECQTSAGGSLKWRIGDDVAGYIELQLSRVGTRVKSEYSYYRPENEITDPISRRKIADAFAVRDNRVSKYRRNMIPGGGQALTDGWLLIEPGTPGSPPTKERDVPNNWNWLHNDTIGIPYGAFEQNSSQYKTVPTTTMVAKINKNLLLASKVAFGPNQGERDSAIVNTHSTPETKNTMRWIRRISNQYFDIARSIASFYASDIGSRRFGKFSEVINAPAFLANNDPCIVTQEQQIAAAALDGIQQRVINFLLNVGPMFVVYVGWLTPDVYSSVESYLIGKVKDDLQQKGMFELYFQSVSQIEKTMSKPVGSTIVDFNFEDVPPGEKLDYVIGQILLVLLNRVGRQTEYRGAAQNLADIREYVLDTQNLSQYFLKGTYTYNIYSPDAPAWRRGQTLPPRNDNNQPDARVPRELGDSVSNSISNLQLENSLLDHRILDVIEANAPANMTWMAYIPMYQIMAMQIMYMDQAIDLTDKYPQFKFYAGRRVAFADDALLEAINPAHIGRFSYQYQDFPVMFNGVEYYSEESVRAQISRLRTVNRLLRQAEEIKDSLRSEVARAAALVSEAERLDQGVSLNGFINGNMRPRFIQKYVDAFQASISDPGGMTQEDYRTGDSLHRTRLGADAGETLDRQKEYLVKDYLSFFEKIPKPGTGFYMGDEDLNTLLGYRGDAPADRPGPNGSLLGGEILTAVGDSNRFSTTVTGRTSAQVEDNIIQAGNILRSLIIDTNDVTFQKLFIKYRRIVELTQDYDRTQIRSGVKAPFQDPVPAREISALIIGADTNFSLPIRPATLSSLIDQMTEFLSNREAESATASPYDGPV